MPPITFPPNCDTPRKRYRYLMRMKRRLIAWQNDRVDNLPADPTPARMAAFKTWERTEFWPRMRNCQRAMRIRRDILVGGTAGELEDYADLVDDGIAATEWDDDLPAAEDIPVED